MDRISELKEKVAKDPSSKLFVPLAEEYRKAGMYEEAIKVLEDGLERQPKYTSARVALGKIYLEKGSLDNARAEFEAVVSSVPDNLYAQRKLADIMRQKGQTEAAIEQYRRVLKLNPMDEEAQMILEDLLKPPAPEEEFLPEDEEFLLSLAQGDGLESGEMLEQAEAVTPLEEEKEEGEKLLYTEQAAPKEEIVEELADAEAEAESEFLEAMEAVPAEGEAEAFEVAEEAAPVEEVLKELEDAEAEAESEFIETGFEELSAVGEALGKAPSLEEAPSDERKAQEHIQKEEYAEAINIYEDILKNDPDNKNALQGLQELGLLLKLLGKDEERTVARLERLLGGIMKRRDEFFGNA